jgi:hypothetical protein
VLEPPFVGRESEFHLLKELLNATGRESRARLVSLVGIAGIGKSRLAWELEKYIDGIAEDVYWHQGRSPAYGEGVAFWALGEMVRARAGIAETIAPAPEDSTRSMATRAGSEERRGSGAARSPARAGEYPLPSAGLFATGGPSSGVGRGTTVMVFGDLQWADQGLFDFIESLLSGRARIHPHRRSRGGHGAPRRGAPGSGTSPPSTSSRCRTRPSANCWRTGARSEPRWWRIVARAACPYAVGHADAGRRGRPVADGGAYRMVGDATEVPDSAGSSPPGSTRSNRPTEPSPDASVLRLSFTSAGSRHQRNRPLSRAHGWIGARESRLDVDPRSPGPGQYAFVGPLQEVAYGTGPNGGPTRPRAQSDRRGDRGHRGRASPRVSRHARRRRRRPQPQARGPARGG